MLKQRLVEINPRESSGPRSANRFDYQHDWALCKLLELHRAGSDYVIVFDYHDDVLVLDSASDPKAVIFYQVKTKQSGTWKRSDLTKQQKGKTGKLPSILGKLYSNYENFPDETTGLQFISNAYFELKLHEGGTGVGRQTIGFVDLDNDERSKLGNSLQNELGKSPSANGVSLFVYQTSDLSLQGHVEHALGKLTSFLDRLPDTTTAGAAAFYRTLKGEITRRTTVEGAFGTFDELCHFKAISRERFESMLQEVRRLEPPSDIVGELRFRLNTEGVPFREVQRICNAARRFVTDRFDPTNRLLTVAEEVVSMHIPGGDEGNEKLYDAIQIALPSCRTSLEAQGIALQDDYIRAIIGIKLSET